MSDLISRQDAIEAVTKYCTKYDLRELLADIEVLPSVEQAQKTGKWIPHEGGKFVGVRYMHYECSECRALNPAETRYCPHCGSKNRGEEE